MAWDPAVLRKYNTTGHFRLLNQVRSELKANPLQRPRDGESVAVVNRSKSLARLVDGRAAAGAGGGGRSRRAPAVSPMGNNPLPAPAIASPARPVPTAHGEFAVVPVLTSSNEESLMPLRASASGLDIDPEMGHDSPSTFRERLNAVEMR
jgi:hypothetical protein